MSDVKDKIAKLLALAESPNENEAKAALLRARELMAEHKLRPEEIGQKNEQTVIRKTIGIYCTKMTDVWSTKLCAIIANHYCCISFRHRCRGQKTVELGLAGLSDDFAICEQAVRYAYDCVKSQCKRLTAEHKKLGCRGAEIRQLCNAYGWGFCSGLQRAFLDQQQAHQEWGLVMVVPKAVSDVFANQKPSTFAVAKTDGWLNRYAREGYADGVKFDMSRRLAPEEERKALA
ncbi:MAG: DUF2786 domain-containing protein [Oscillospiraceae bacterium]|nr:DUF2786 domain-containing protein [Oscillospiraceae bacterium]MBR0313022.1 DUF2786 domain-containing protein [Oscillospiraceae bacterium]